MKTPQEELLELGVKPDHASPVLARKNAEGDQEFKAWTIRVNSLLREIHGAKAIPYTYEGDYLAGEVRIPWKVDGDEESVNLDTFQPQELVEQMAPDVIISIAKNNALINGILTNFLPTKARTFYKY